jgi:23S rRNA (uracil1939-C5)-methyltransferase
MLEFVLQRDGKMPLQVPAGAFSQVNEEINLQLVESAVRAVPEITGKTMYDLYAGAGNFSLPFARAGAHVTAVEAEKRLVHIGRQNAQRSRLEKNIVFIESSVERFLASRPRGFPGDAVVADPPRSGLGPLASALGGAPRILLVSCHLPSFVRDLKALVSNGYCVESIQPFDMFAQTSYSEVLCSLIRR